MTVRCRWQNPWSWSDDPHSFSAFSYHVEIPQIQVPYLIDIEFPDDTRRNVAVYLSWLSEWNGAFTKGNKYEISNSYGKAFVTGGTNPFSNQLQHHRVIAWGGSPYLAISPITQEYGTRGCGCTY